MNKALLLLLLKRNKMKGILKAVYYNRELEVITNNFKEWLKDHNEIRESDGEIKELADEFSVEDVTTVIYDKREKIKEEF